MAYMDFSPLAAPVGPVVTPRADPPRADVPSDARFSALEWSVIALARYDRIASLAQPGRLAVALGKVFGTRPQGLHLADPRLEALRRMAVLSWRQGDKVAVAEHAAFAAAGFTPDHYRLMRASMAAAA